MMNHLTSWKVSERADGRWVVLRNGHPLGASQPTFKTAGEELKKQMAQDNWWDPLPMSKPCEAAAASKGAFVCPQGMALEIDAYDPTGGTQGLPKVPRVRYRCQDCDHEFEIEVTR